MSAIGRQALVSLRALLYALAWTAMIIYVLFTLLYQCGSWTWREDSVWGKLRSSYVLRYTMLEGYETLMYAWYTQGATFLGIPVAVAAIAITAAAYLCGHDAQEASPASASKRCVWLADHMRVWWQKFKELCAWPLPPRGFWLRWCDGLNALEAFLVVGFGIAHVVLVKDIVTYYGQMSDAFEEAGVYLNVPRSVVNLEWIGLAWGWAIWLDLTLLFMPLAHNSFLNHIMGAQYSSLVRYHRWLGHFTMISTSMHGLFYYAFWLCDPTKNFWDQALDWSTHSSINFLAGTISWGFGIILWVTSIEYVRRFHFETFYRLHIIGFFGYVLFAEIHFYPNWTVFVPGLSLYAADVIMRICQAQNLSAMVLAGHAAQAAGKVMDGDVAALQIPVAKDTAVAAGQDLYILVPSVSRWQWHPFTIGNVSTQTHAANARAVASKGVDDSADTNDSSSSTWDDSTRVATLYVKSAGHWTQAVMTQALLKGSLPVRVIGPFGGLDTMHYRKYDTILLVAGGIGVAPILTILRDLLSARHAGQHPRRVRLLWAVRHAEEFGILDEAIAVAAAENSTWLSMQLHCTKPIKVPIGSKAGIKLEDKVKCSKDQNAQLGPVVSSTCPATWAAVKTCDAGRTVLKAARSASGFMWSIARPVQPQLMGSNAMGGTVLGAELHRCVTVLMVLLGAFFGVVLTHSGYVETAEASGDYNTWYWRVGLTATFVIGFQMLGLPMALVVFPLHLYRHLKLSTTDALTPADAEKLAYGHRMPTVVGHNLIFLEPGISLEVLMGRPDLEHAVQQALADAQESSAIGADGHRAAVICAGPATMNLAVHELVLRTNDKAATSGSCIRLDFHKEAYEL